MITTLVFDDTSEQLALGCASFSTLGMCLSFILGRLFAGKSTLALCTSFTQFPVSQHESERLEVH